MRVDDLRAERDAIRAEIEARGYNEAAGELHAARSTATTLDASLLTLPLYGYVDGAHPRMRSTCARIHERLGRDALVYRYQGTG